VLASPVLLVVPAAASADSISLASHSGGAYDYDLVFTSGLFFPAGEPVIVLSGLSGVTGASVSGFFRVASQVRL
jgi:hypothetical protein